MFCRNCGKEINGSAKFCQECGSDTGYGSSSKILSTQSTGCSPKSRTVAALLAFFLGWLGIHRFYVEKIGTGILQILLTCCFGLGVIWAFIDLIVILCGNFTDKSGLRITDWNPRY